MKERNGKRKKAQEERQEKANWAKAQRQAAQSGIVLTQRKDSNGDYVCYLSKKARHNLLFRL